MKKILVFVVFAAIAFALYSVSVIVPMAGTYGSCWKCGIWP